MARFSVTHSEDACCIDIRGDIRRPEPSTAVIRFPGGHVEVARHRDGSYWVHVARNTRVNDPESDVLGQIVDGRIDITNAAQGAYTANVLPMPAAEHIEHLALRIARADRMHPREAAAPDDRQSGQAAGAAPVAQGRLNLEAA